MICVGILYEIMGGENEVCSCLLVFYGDLIEGYLLCVL